MEYQQEDIQKGDFVTVLVGQKYEHHSDSMLGGTATLVNEDNSYKGDVLEVLCVDYPFAIFKNHSDRVLPRPINLDLRKWKLKKLSQEYVRIALTPTEEESKRD